MNEMPLLNLFTQLREVGLLLGIEEYEAVLRAIDAGYGVADQEALARLCQMLWVKSEDDQRKFDYYFELLVVPPQPTQIVSPPVRVPPISRQRFPWKYLAIGLLAGVITVGGGFAVKEILRKIPTPEQTSQPTLSPSPTNLFPGLINANQPFRPLQIREVLVVIAGVASSAGLVVGIVWLLQSITDRWVQEGQSRPRIATKTPEFALASESTQLADDQPQTEQIVLQASVGESRINHRRVSALDEFFPVTRRQMQQSWRYLRNLTTQGTMTEVNVPATVNQIGRQGIFLKPVLVLRQTNRTQLLILLDQGGSMMPFQALSSRLVETARRSRRLGEVSAFHFHNCPTDLSDQNSAQRLVESLDTILGRLGSRRIVILIFSDAGAARGQFNLNRIDQTEEFLIKVRQRVRYVSWLNPMPRQRWVGTTAAEIAYLVPMFEMNRQGLNRAIAVLQGQPIASEGRR